MDNAGDWIYIVLLVVIGISSLFGKKNKRRPTEILGQPDMDYPSEEGKTTEKGFWEMLEEEFNQTAQPKPAPAKPTASQKRKLKKQEEGARLLTDTSVRTIDISQEETNPLLEDIDFKNTEELRKAVIYSEILNRKY